MLKVPLYAVDGKKKGEISLDESFQKDIRGDVIKKVFLAEQANARQPYGSDPKAGFRSSARFHGRRSRRNSMQNREMARMKRITGQGFLNFTARVVPQAIKGRKAHPPKANKNWLKKINKKEKLFAIKSAISASASKDYVTERGHKIDLPVPIIFEDKFQDIKNTKTVKETLISIGLGKELERTKKKKVRAGKGTMRGRKYRVKKGPLIVVEKDSEIKKTARNIPGVDVVELKDLSLSLLAPGGHPGRLTIWTKSAAEAVKGM